MAVHPENAVRVVKAAAILHNMLQSITRTVDDDDHDIPQAEALQNIEQRQLRRCRTS